MERNEKGMEKEEVGNVGRNGKEMLIKKVIRSQNRSQVLIKWTSFQKSLRTNRKGKSCRTKKSCLIEKRIACSSWEKNRD